MSSSEKGKSLPGNLKRLGILFVATGGFSGFFPVAPGTAGSLVGLGIVWLFQGAPASVLFLSAALILALGIWTSNEACHILKREDPGQVVIDEIVGMMLTMVGIPVSPYWLVVGFLLFRVLDVVKPAPAKYCDTKLEGGLGVMLDDVVSGIYANLILRLMLRAQI